jgi:pimeloyl-ACP methyl ester carboxylesterase
VVAGGVRFHVRELGAAGPGERGSLSPALLLHGFPETGECWRRVAPRLAHGRRVIVPDLPGFGASGPPPAHDARTVAGSLAALLEALDAPRAVVVGHDWGGSLALALALERPERVAALVVVNAPFRTLDLRRGIHFLAFNLPLLPEAALLLGGRRLLAAMLRAGAARPGAFDPDAVDAYAAALAAPEAVRRALAYYRTMTRRLLLRRLRRRGPARPPRAVAAPTLVVWGMRDPVLPETVLAGLLRDVPGARVVRLEDVGHFVPEEAPEELAAEIEAFLAGI